MKVIFDCALTFSIFILFSVSYVVQCVDQNPDEVHGNKFYYFGFGSNLLSKRIHINNPSAKIIGPALLDDYRLDFSMPSAFWKGAVATIVPTPGSHTWGALWDIDVANLSSLDHQELVHLGLYRPVTVKVKLHGNGTEYAARGYVITDEPKSNLHELRPDEVPVDRQPSKTYLKVIVKGAIESGLPEEYVNKLKGLKHNNETVQDKEEYLELQNVQL